jgi:trehalose synthase
MMGATTVDRRVTMLREVDVKGLAPDRLDSLIGPERAEHFGAVAASTRAALQGRTVLNVNSTAAGGGVAEMLQTLLAYARCAGVDARWVVIEGDPRFFEITKRVHNLLYGTPGDGGPLGPAERADYEATLQRNAAQLLALVEAGDIVVLHDPQPAGLSSALMRAGAQVVWRCHIGVDTPNAYSEYGWDFVRPYVEGVDGFVFSCEQFAPSWVPRERLRIIAPSIDPFSAKNEAIEERATVQRLQYVGLLGGDATESGVTFTRRDGSRGRVTRRADLLGTGPPPPIDAPIVLQASRWDALKDMSGVLEGFATRIADHTDAHLILAGPEASGVTDDPEANGVLRDCVARWHRLARRLQRRAHLALLPMHDADENAAMLNALQRHASVVVQKSLAEGFGLTVVEAMWKSRPVVASAVGGIVDQVIPGETGLLLGDAHDLDQFGEAVLSLLHDASESRRMGMNGHQRTVREFLGDRHLEQWAQVFACLDGRE